jgi:hypothetical protein
MRTVFTIIVCFLGSMVFAQQDLNTWPREIKAGDNYVINLYQPQLETLEDNKLVGRMALSVIDDKDKIIFGALWFEAHLSTDLESNTAVLESFDIPKIKFPDVDNEEGMNLLKSLIIDDFSAMEIEMSIDNIISNLESIAENNAVNDKLSNQPPTIYFRQEPTVLISIDGDPILKKVEDGSMEYVVNTPFFIVKKKSTFYLKGEQNWYQSNTLVSNDWKTTKSVPKDIQKLADKKFDTPGKKEEGDKSTPNIIVVTSPAELIITNGELDYKPISGTSLLSVDNTESDIILEIDTQTHFVLLNGRWYGTKTMKDKEWQFVEPKDLPESFKSIPADNDSFTAIRTSIPGTLEAKEAMYEQYMPQTAVVDKKTASTKVVYDGNPKFEEIEGTTMQYAVNTQSKVLEIDELFYVIDDGVWFESRTATGPWKVSEERPEEVKDIPPSSPVYNVKYVYIYDSTPEVVYVGYTPGYYHSYMYSGVVVYGTGYYYYPWYGVHYYPRPVTYGYGVHYNPYTGWGFSVGVSYGWMTVSFRSGGYWGPAGYRHGYRHGYNRGYHRGYNNGYAAGYARGRYNSSNIYRRPNGNNPRTGISTRNGRTTRNNSRPSTNDRPNNTRPSTNDRRNNTSPKRNNLYSDKSGNVYQRNNNGDWQQKRNNTRQNPNSNRRTTPSTNNRTTPNVNRNQQRNQLNNQYNNRSRGNTNTRNYNNNRSSRGSRQSMPRRRG